METVAVGHGNNYYNFDLDLEEGWKFPCEVISDMLLARIPLETGNECFQEVLTLHPNKCVNGSFFKGLAWPSKSKKVSPFMTSNY